MSDATNVMTDAQMDAEILKVKKVSGEHGMHMCKDEGFIFSAFYLMRRACVRTHAEAATYRIIKGVKWVRVRGGQGWRRGASSSEPTKS